MPAATDRPVVRDPRDRARIAMSRRDLCRECNRSVCTRHAPWCTATRQPGHVVNWSARYHARSTR